MFLVIFGIIFGAWALLMGWKFYQNVDWSEPADPSPDLQGMHKREAELLRIQTVLEDACDQGKLSRSVLEEFNRFSETEISAIHEIETTWKNRHKKL